MRGGPPISRLLQFTAIAVGCWASAESVAEPAEVWESQPYRIRAELAIDAPGDLAQQLTEQLPEYLKERASTAIGIVWRLKVEVAGGPLRYRLLTGIDSFTAEDVANDASDDDKRLLLSVRATPWGYDLTAREYDRYLNRWGPTIRRTTRQRDVLPEQLFELVEQAVSPLAQVRVDPEDPQRVELDMRGSDLPISGADFAWTKAGDVFLPVLRRTTRDGVLLEEGVTTVPWTYLEVVAPPADATQPAALVRAATQRPLGVRRGRVSLVAIGMRADPGPTTVHLQARTTPTKPLVDYEVLAQDVFDNTEKPQMRSAGRSDAAGEVTLTPGGSPIQMLFVRSDGVFLARLPLVPGAVDRIAVPLPDDDVRLKVAARLTALREDVIDLVARRNIFMARARQQIEERHFDEARQLLEALDALPGPTQFNQALDREAQLHRTNDQQVQRRIDSLFSQTRAALGKFLDPRTIGALHEQLRQAQEPDEESRAESDKETS